VFNADKITKTGIKSLNYHKAILLLEEFIIAESKSILDNKGLGTEYDEHHDINKIRMLLFKLHEACDLSGSSNIMADEDFKNNHQEASQSQEKIDEVEKELEKVDIKDFDQSAHDWMYRSKSKLLEWESICENLDDALQDENLNTDYANILLKA
jgi:hypothetical protein